MTSCSLSICIPTYNRSDRILRLASKFLSHDGPFELCVHDDGSTDDTYERLVALALTDGRLKPSSAPNQGRAGALRQAVARAEGQYVMLFDDDDEIYIGEFEQVLQDCHSGSSAEICGFIYQMSINGKLPSAFPVERANLISLRADHGVTGDKKEVVKTGLLKPIVATQPNTRRVPTSLYWSKLSLSHDVLCRNLVVGNKIYLEEGMSDMIARLKAKSPEPMMTLHGYRIYAFMKGRYRSPRFLLKSCAAFADYALRTVYSRLTAGRS